MVCCLTAKHMGAKFTIARIRNPEYSMGLNDLKKDLGIDMIINPENATAIEISRLLRFPSAANIETFCRGRVELMGFRIQEGGILWRGSPCTTCPTRSSGSPCCSAPWTGEGRGHHPQRLLCAPGGG